METAKSEDEIARCSENSDFSSFFEGVSKWHEQSSKTVTTTHASPRSDCNENEMPPCALLVDTVDDGEQLTAVFGYFGSSIYDKKPVFAFSALMSVFEMKVLSRDQKTVITIPILRKRLTADLKVPDSSEPAYRLRIEISQEGLHAKLRDLAQDNIIAKFEVAHISSSCCTSREATLQVENSIDRKTFSFARVGPKPSFFWFLCGSHSDFEINRTASSDLTIKKHFLASAANDESRREPVSGYPRGKPTRKRPTTIITHDLTLSDPLLSPEIAFASIVVELLAFGYNNIGNAAARANRAFPKGVIMPYETAPSSPPAFTMARDKVPS